MSNAAEDLARISQMADVLVSARETVAAAEDELSEAKAQLARIETEDFPELMREVGLTEVKLEDGRSIKLMDEVQCSITQENKPAAHKWLRSNKFGGLIKTVLSVQFGRDEDAKVKTAKAALVKLGYAPELGEAVHAQTLKAFVKEQRAKGKSPPEKLFGIFPFTKAVVKLPKQ